MNKNVFGVIAIFGFLSTVFLFMSIFIWAFNNDYILYEVNVQAENLEEIGVISQYDLDQIEITGNEHASLNFYFDQWWLLSAIIMVIGTVLLSYYSREENMFSFLSYLFFGTMTILFVVLIINQFTDWFIADIFYKMIPNMDGAMPMFDYYREHIGMFSFIHILVCLLANRLYFKIKEFTKKKDITFTDTEVV